MPQARTYSLYVIAMTLALLGATALGNAVTDPYGIYGWFDRQGANANKPGQKGHDRLVKAYAIRHLQPDALLLGTSRVQYGLNPDDEALHKVAKRPYNGALLGSNIYMALRYLQHAHALSPVRVAVLGLDPLMFDDANSDALRDFSEERLAVDANNEAQPFATVTDVPSTLLSYDTTRLSVRTWRKQAHIVSDLTAGGQRSPQALARLYPAGVPMMERFMAVDEEYARNYKKARWPTSLTTSASLQAFERLVSFAAQAGIRLEVYFTPEHVHLHEVARQSGQEPAIAALYASVLDVVERAQAKATSPATVQLWCMATLNPLTQEAIPTGAFNETGLQWFHEPTHAKEALGHLVLSRMLDPAPTPQAQMVGEPITGASLPHILAERAQRLTQWETGHPDEVAALRQHAEARP
jgi:hypothetical protein